MKVQAMLRLGVAGVLALVCCVFSLPAMAAQAQARLTFGKVFFEGAPQTTRQNGAKAHGTCDQGPLEYFHIEIIQFQWESFVIRHVLCLTLRALPGGSVQIHFPADLWKKTWFFPKSTPLCGALPCRAVIPIPDRSCWNWNKEPAIAGDRNRRFRREQAGFARR